MSKKSSTFAPAFERRQHGGHSSVGRASDCGSECRGFEPHSPPPDILRDVFFLYSGLYLAVRIIGYSVRFSKQASYTPALPDKS